MEVTAESLEDMCGLMCDNRLPEKEHKICLRCGRKLKSAESKALGYGKICYQKMQQKPKTSLFN